MDQTPDQSISLLLNELDAGREGAFVELVEAAYQQLRGIAHKQMRRRFGPQPGPLTLQPTALVNDAIMELAKQRKGFENSEQFFAIATRLMLRLVIDYQRHRLAQKRGGGRRGGILDSSALGRGPKAAPQAPHQTTDPVVDATHEAIRKLHELDPRKAEVVTLHVLCGVPLPAVAEAVNVSLPTVERDWRFAKAWLAKELGPDIGRTRAGGSGTAAPGEGGGGVGG